MLQVLRANDFASPQTLAGFLREVSKLAEDDLVNPWPLLASDLYQVYWALTKRVGNCHALADSLLHASQASIPFIAKKNLENIATEIEATLPHDTLAQIKEDLFSQQARDVLAEGLRESVSRQT